MIDDQSAIEVILDRVSAWGLRRGITPEQRLELGRHRVAMPELQADGSLCFECVRVVAERIGEECGGGHLYERWELSYVDAAYKYAERLWPVSAVYLVAYVYAILGWEEPSREAIAAIERWEDWAHGGYEGPEPLE